VLAQPRDVPTPKFVRKLVRGNIDKTVSVDFDGNGKPDYIATVTDPSETSESRRTRRLWVNDAHHVVKTTAVSDADTDEFWFLQQRAGTVPLIISAWGYEDGIDYAVVQQNLRGGKDKVLFLFDPVIRENNKLFWGYPWDWSDIVAEQQNRGMAVLCTFNHDLHRDPDEGNNQDLPPAQKSIPVIIFTGHTTQPDTAKISPERIRSPHWCKIPEMERRSRR
jgi:hypothetical protein